MSIAIVGLGILCAIGNDKDQVLQSLRARRTGIGEMRCLHSVHHELPVGEVKCSNEELKEQLGIDPQQEISRTALLGMAAMRQALESAGIVVGTDADARPADTPVAGHPRTLFINGTTVGGMDITEQHFGVLRAHPDGPLSDADLECLHHHDCGSSTEDIVRHFGCFDDWTTISTACSSAANAIILGAQLLEAGKADRVVVGGTEALSVFHLNGFNSLMILDHEPCRPFDKERAGLNLGEGAA
ncbi:MAG: beta-ketoacyl synthase N-terminal-like domain-containing protein, partial [Prevotellaceae bacterium]|nr:beta-ketoacyl synthase N-terminal-like domain-containing protein [Prevotellaceae bacterium]